MMRENGYIREDVNLFVKHDLPIRIHSAALTEIGAPAGPEKVVLPEATELHYLKAVDTGKLPHHDQIEVGVLKTEVLSNEVSVGYYPGFISITLQPQLEGYDPQLVAIPVFTKAWNVLEQEAGSIVRTTQTKLGGQIGWGPFTLSAERSWGTEFEESRDASAVVCWKEPVFQSTWV